MGYGGNQQCCACRYSRIEPFSTDPKDYRGYTKDKLIAQVTDKAVSYMRLRKKEFPEEPEQVRELERVVF